MARKPKPPPACTACRAPVLFARVTGRQGRPVTIPLDPEPAAGGTVAAHRTASGSLTGRFLARGEKPYGYERMFRQHRCPKAPDESAATSEQAGKVSRPEPQAALFDAEARF